MGRGGCLRGGICGTAQQSDFFLNFSSSDIDAIDWSPALKHWKPTETSLELIPKIPPKTH